MPSVAFRGACPHNTQVNELLRKKTYILWSEQKPQYISNLHP